MEELYKKTSCGIKQRKKISDYIFYWNANYFSFFNNFSVVSPEEQCRICLEKYKSDNTSVVCSSNNDERRIGIKANKNNKIFLCSSKSATKTSKLFKEKIEILSYCIPSIIKVKENAISEATKIEQEKYSRIVHNLKTLNAQSIQSQFKFVPQRVFADNYNNLYEFLNKEIKNRPDDATIALLRLSKNNAHMKTEFSTHEKLSVENPNLLIHEHNLRSVILNVYHSFDLEFKENKVAFVISDSEYFVSFDYDTIRVALYHLFSNTIKYICNSSKLQVKIYKKENLIYVDFEMKSLHIGKDEELKIFEDHYSGRSTKVKQKNGSGLGGNTGQPDHIQPV